MTIPLLLTGGFILLTCWLWHHALVREHQRALRLVKQMQEWKQRNEFDLDDWMGGGDE